MTGLTFEDIQRERDEVLSCSKTKIRQLADYIDAVISDDTLVVVGSESKIDQNREIFGKVDNLL